LHHRVRPAPVPEALVGARAQLGRPHVSSRSCPPRDPVPPRGDCMPEAFIVDAVRTPVGRRGGALAGVHPADLGAHVIKALFDRANLDPVETEDVVFGCVDTIGPQAGDIARTAWLAAGFPEEVPGVTVD